MEKEKEMRTPLATVEFKARTFSQWLFIEAVVIPELNEFLHQYDEILKELEGEEE